MKYKAKFTAHPEPHYSGYTSKVDTEFTYNDQDGKGVFVFIPFTDTRFFEPVKTRKFVIEVDENHVEDFKFLLQLEHDARWIGAEITEPTVPYWVIEFESQYPEATIDSYEGINPEWIVENFKGRRADAGDWLRTHCDCGVVSAQRLMDYLFNNFN